MGSTEEFIGLYYKLWDYLLETTDSDHSTDFDELVDEAAKMNGVVKNEARRIKDFGKLSNTLRNHNLNQIAEPTENALSEFKRLVDNIICPKNLIPTFQTEIRCFSPKEQLINALKYMRDYDFSQVIVQNGGKLTLLTVEGVANWVGGQAEKETISIAEVRVRDALLCDITDSFVVMGPQNTIYDAQEAFGKAIEKMHPRLFAIIISDTGKPTGKAIGIVTPYDLTPADALSGDYVFRKQEDFWNIVFEGKCTLLKDNKGLQYIAYLLSHPREKHHVLDLEREVDGVPVEFVDRGRRKRTTKELTDKKSTGNQDHCLPPDENFDSILDAQAREKIKEELNRLERELEEAMEYNDLEKASLIRAQKENILEHLAKASGLFGRSRKFGDEGEKARRRVTAAIKRAREAIGKHNNDLWSHLNSCIRTGYSCSYEPSEDIEWSF